MRGSFQANWEKFEGLRNECGACAHKVVTRAHNTPGRRKPIYQIPPELNETMRTAGRYRAAASDLKLEKPE
jgi:hypothetical protein